MTDDAQADNKRTGLTRRQLIQRSAIAGGIVWTAPLIDSVVSSAAAVSHPGLSFPDCGNNCPRGDFNCSAGFVLFTKTGVPGIFYVKINECTATCGSDSDCGVPVDTKHPYPGGTCNGNAITDTGHGLSYGGTDATCDNGNCASDVIINGNTVSPGPGIRFLAAVVHDG